MNVAEAVQALSALTYKPGWKIVVYSTPGALVLRVGKPEPDRYAKTPTTIDVVLTDTLPEHAVRNMGLTDLLRWVFGVVERRELHEVEEWLRLDGVPLRAPHPGRGVPGLLGNGRSTPT